MATSLSPLRLQQKLEQYGLHPRKGLGQNFLVDENTRRRIITAAELHPGDRVLEIGPGAGALTEVLLENCSGVVAVELDRGLVQLLQDSFGSYPHFTLIEADARRVDLVKICRQLWGGQPVKVIANIPYYLTSPLVFTLLRQGAGIFQQLLLMVQKEAALRITASPGGKEYGLLSLAAAYYSKPRLLFSVPPTVFFPRPEVESALVRLETCNPRREVVDEKLFWVIAEAAFSQRRKTLLNNLSRELHINKDIMIAVFKQAQVNPADRGERLGIEEFANLTAYVYNYLGKKRVF